MRNKKFSKIVKFIVSFNMCLLAGFVGSLFSSPALPSWYAQLNKPVFNPPNGLFMPVWGILYLLMATALFIVWRKGLKTKKIRWGVYLFVVQLILNALWSVIFFGIHSILGALFVSIALWIAIFYTITAFSRVSKLAAGLLIPYILWVSFAIVLNYFLLILN